MSKDLYRMKKIIRMLKSLFKRFGEIRKLQINFRNTDNSNKRSGSGKRLEKTGEKARQELMNELRKTDKKSLKKIRRHVTEEIDVITDDVLVTSVEEFIKTGLRDLKKLSVHLVVENDYA